MSVRARCCHHDDLHNFIRSRNSTASSSSSSSSEHGLACCYTHWLTLDTSEKTVRCRHCCCQPQAGQTAQASASAPPAWLDSSSQCARALLVCTEPAAAASTCVAAQHGCMMMSQLCLLNYWPVQQQWQFLSFKTPSPACLT